MPEIQLPDAALNAWQLAIVVLLSLAMVAPFLWHLRRGPGTYTQEGYYLAWRKMPVFFLAMSLAGSWVWAPALFVSSQMAYQKGLAGAFWFIVPNVACFFILIPIARRIKRRYSGYTLAGYFAESTGGSRLVLGVFAVVTLAFQMCALIENNIALGMMVSTVTGFSRVVSGTILFGFTVIGVLLILLHGFKGSVLTDTFQMSIMLVLCVVVALMVYFSFPANVSLSAGLGGSTGEFTNPLMLSVVLNPGIAMALGLIGGPMGDMMFFQRIMALRSERDVARTLALAGVFFAVVPVTLAIPGFMAAAAEPAFAAANPEAIGLVTTATVAPKIATILFCVIIVGGLVTTLVSAYSAITCIAGRDFFPLAVGRQRTNEDQATTGVRFSAITMVVLAAIGFLVAISGVSLLPVFLADAAIASSIIVPVVYATLSKRMVTHRVVVPLVCGFVFAVTCGGIGAALDWAEVSAAAAPGAFLTGLVALAVTHLFRGTRWAAANNPSDSPTQPLPPANR